MSEVYKISGPRFADLDRLLSEMGYERIPGSKFLAKYVPNPNPKKMVLMIRISDLAIRNSNWPDQDFVPMERWIEWQLGPVVAGKIIEKMKEVIVLDKESYSSRELASLLGIKTASVRDAVSKHRLTPSFKTLSKKNCGHLRFSRELVWELMNNSR